MKRMLLLCAIPALLLSMLCSCGKSQEERWQEQYDLGVRYLSEGNYEEAIIAFTAAIEIDPNRAEAYVGRGDAYVASGETEENLTAAMVDYEAALDLDETLVDAWLSLADVYIRQEDYDKAISVLQDGLEKTENAAAIADKLNSVEEYLSSAGISDLTVLTRQEWTEYGIGGDVSRNYIVFKYNDEGYLIHRESWYSSTMSHNGEWIMAASEDWDYDENSDLWTRTTYSQYNNQWETSTFWEREPGTIEGYATSSYGAAAVYINPYPSDKTQIIYNQNIEIDSSRNWAYAEYEYDENGNTTLIQNYNSNGELIGYCEFEYAVVQVQSE